MRFALVAFVLFLPALCHGAEEAPNASRKLEGRTTPFPAETIAEGVKATVAVLESCRSSDDGARPNGVFAYSAADITKAQQGDHVRLQFAKPVKVTILDVTWDVSEVVYADGVFWLRCGPRVVRASKYEHEQWKSFAAWFRQPLP